MLRNIHSASADKVVSNNNNRNLRLPRRPSSEPLSHQDSKSSSYLLPHQPHVNASTSDLGSDDEWQCREGRVSDEDALDLVRTDSDPASTRSAAHVEDPSRAFKWSNDDEEAFVEDVRDAPLPLPLSTCHPHTFHSNSSPLLANSVQSANPTNIHSTNHPCLPDPYDPVSFDHLSSSLHSRHTSQCLSPDDQDDLDDHDLHHLSDHESPHVLKQLPPHVPSPVPGYDYEVDHRRHHHQVAFSSSSLAHPKSHSPRPPSLSPDLPTHHHASHDYSVSAYAAHASTSDEDDDHHHYHHDHHHDHHQYDDDHHSDNRDHNGPHLHRPRHHYQPNDQQQHHSQRRFIPGFRGISSRIPVSTAEGDANTHGHGWADRPRGATASHAHPPPSSSDPASGQSSPARSRLHRVGSDSGVSSQGGSIGSGSALRLSTRSSSSASDASKRPPPKSLAYISNTRDTSSTLISDDPLTNLTTPVSMEHDRKISAVRLGGADFKDRLSNASSHSSIKREGRTIESTPHIPDATSDLDNPSPINRTTHYSSIQGSHPPEDSSLLPHDSSAAHSNSTSAASSTPVQNRGSIKSDVGPYDRQPSELTSSSTRGERPLSSPSMYHQEQTHLENIQAHDLYLPKALYNSSGTENATNSSTTTSSAIDSVRGGVTFGTTTASRGGFGKRPSVSPSPGFSKMSFLECVVEMLKGATAYKRKTFLQASEATVWLTPDLQLLQLRMVQKKTSTSHLNSVKLPQVRRLRGSDREVIIEAMGTKKPLTLIFSTREKAEIWLSGLSCLVPSNAIVRSSRNRNLNGSRRLYDPLMDTWNSKSLANRKRIFEYIMLGSIGRGSFGKVKLAISSLDMRFYAVKVLSKAILRKRMRNSLDLGMHDSQDSKLTVENVNEITVLHGLRHVNVMELKAAYDDPIKGLIYIVVEYLPKGPIMNSSTLTDANPIPEDRARLAFVDVLCGMEYLHRNKVVHLDIKPDNLLEAGDGTVKISDFGAAAKYTGSEVEQPELEGRSGNTVGTPAFTAPELCLSEKAPPRPAHCYPADIWSLGASLFYMLYGRAPFLASGVFEMYDAICTRPLKFPDSPNVSEQAQRLIRDMLEKKPGERATISSIMRAQWLKDCVDVAEKLTELRAALLLHQDDARTQQARRQELQQQEQHDYIHQHHHHHHQEVPGQVQQQQQPSSRPGLMNARIPYSKSLSNVNGLRIRSHQR